MKKIYLIAAVVALAAGVATYFFANELKTSKAVTGTEHQTVLIAIEDIDEETVLTKEMFAETKVPVGSVLNGALSNLADVEGYIAGQKIFAGEQLISQKLVQVGAGVSNDRLSYQLESGMYAYSVYVKEENAVSYFIQEGDRVNIYNDAVPSIEPVFEKVEVIRVGERVVVQTEQESAAYSVLTIVLSKEQIPKMMEMEDPDETSAQFRIVLVPQSEVLGVENETKPVAKEPETLVQSEVPVETTVPAEPEKPAA